MTSAEMVASAAHATRPWKSMSATILNFQTARFSSVYTDQALIDKCLECKRPTCTNCLDPRSIRRQKN